MPGLKAPLTLSILAVVAILALILYVPAKVLGYVLLSVGPTFSLSLLWGMRDY